MKAAVAPRAAREVRLLHLVEAVLHDRRYADLPALLGPGDLLVVNDAATLPAALPAHLGDHAVEVRLAGELRPSRTRAVLFGAGTWRERTEDRAPPPVARRGDTVRFLGGLTATVVEVSPISPRLVDLAFDRGGEALLGAIYAAGRPVQYSYLGSPLPLWAVQTPFAARPWAVEAPSAGHPLVWETLLALRRRGVALARLTHAAGLSATGDPALDAALPLPERYDIPAETVRALGDARRVVAVGTTVVRALEGAATRGSLVPGSGTTDLRLSAATPLRIVDAVLTGIHTPGESHFELLGAFVDELTLARAAEHAARAGYLTHEFGDAMLVHRAL